MHTNKVCTGFDVSNFDASVHMHGDILHSGEFPQTNTNLVTDMKDWIREGALYKELKAENE